MAFRTERDDEVYLDDAVGIFINPKPLQTGIYFGLELTVRGALLDYLMYDSHISFRCFNMTAFNLRLPFKAP